VGIISPFERSNIDEDLEIAQFPVSGEQRKGRVKTIRFHTAR